MAEKFFNAFQAQQNVIQAYHKRHHDKNDVTEMQGHVFLYQHQMKEALKWDVRDLKRELREVEEKIKVLEKKLAEK